MDSKKITTIAIVLGVGFLSYKLYNEIQRIKSRKSGIKGNNNLQNEYPSLSEEEPTPEPQPQPEPTPDWRDNVLTLTPIDKNTTETPETTTARQRCMQRLGIWKINSSGVGYCDTGGGASGGGAGGTKDISVRTQYILGLKTDSERLLDDTFLGGYQGEKKTSLGGY